MTSTPRIEVEGLSCRATGTRSWLHMPSRLCLLQLLCSALRKLVQAHAVAPVHPAAPQRVRRHLHTS